MARRSAHRLAERLEGPPGPQSARPMSLAASCARGRRDARERRWRCAGGGRHAAACGL